MQKKNLYYLLWSPMIYGVHTNMRNNTENVSNKIIAHSDFQTHSSKETPLYKNIPKHIKTNDRLLMSYYDNNRNHSLNNVQKEYFPPLKREKPPSHRDEDAYCNIM